MDTAVERLFSRERPFPSQPRSAARALLSPRPVAAVNRASARPMPSVCSACLVPSLPSSSLLDCRRSCWACLKTASRVLLSRDGVNKRTFRAESYEKFNRRAVCFPARSFLFILKEPICILIVSARVKCSRTSSLSPCLKSFHSFSSLVCSASPRAS